jgi:hypothetical protein
VIQARQACSRGGIRLPSCEAREVPQQSLGGLRHTSRSREASPCAGAESGSINPHWPELGSPARSHRSALTVRLARLALPRAVAFACRCWAMRSFVTRERPVGMCVSPFKAAVEIALLSDEASCRLLRSGVRRVARASTLGEFPAGLPDAGNRSPGGWPAWATFARVTQADVGLHVTHCSRLDARG